MSESRNSIPGQNWQKWEIDLVVADYFEMLRLELAGQFYNKSEHRRRLQQFVKRSDASLEMKHQNISAVLELLAMPTISGYKRLTNYQQALVDGVEEYLTTHAVPSAPTELVVELAEKPALLIGAAPVKATIQQKPKVDLNRILRKFDPAARDARNRSLGLMGEELVFENEIKRLHDVNRKDLARRVRHVSKEDGDGLGYDIHSFDEDGRDRLVEVKTTTGTIATPFYLTSNEHAVSAERPEAYRLLRVYQFGKSPQAFELLPPLEDHVNLMAAVYRASFGNPAVGEG